LTLRMETQIKKQQNMLSTYKLHLKYLSPLNQIQEKRMLGMDLEGKLEIVMKRKLTAKKHELALIVERMKGLSPLDKLSQGYAFVENVVTHADFRGNGYAGECLDYAKKIAEKENCYKMMLLTGSKKPETMHFYEKAGYNSSDKTAFIQWIGMDK